MQTQTAASGIEYTVVTAAELNELNAETAHSLSSTPCDMVVGVIMLVEGAPLGELVDAFDTVVVNRSQTYGTWFTNPPHVVVAWVFHAQIELEKDGTGVTLRTQSILSPDEMTYRVAGGQDLVYINEISGSYRDVDAIMVGQQPSMYRELVSGV